MARVKVLIKKSMGTQQSYDKKDLLIASPEKLTGLLTSNDQVDKVHVMMYNIINYKNTLKRSWLFNLPKVSIFEDTPSNLQ